MRGASTGLVWLIVTASVAGGVLMAHQGGDDQAGSIRGVVRISASMDVPPPRVIQNATDPGVCGASHALRDLVVDPGTRGLADAIVSIEGAPSDRTPPSALPRLVIDNLRCRFTPHVAVVRVGTELVAANSDDVLHTVHAYGPLEANLSLPFKGMTRSWVIARPGLYAVKCDIHGWMQAWVRADAHGFHAVTGGRGEFAIGDVPPGRYTLVTWHAALGERRSALAVRPGVTAVEVEFPAR